MPPEKLELDGGVVVAERHKSECQSPRAPPEAGHGGVFMVLPD